MFYLTPNPLAEIFADVGQELSKSVLTKFYVEPASYKLLTVEIRRADQKAGEEKTYTSDEIMQAQISDM